MRRNKFPPFITQLSLREKGLNGRERVAKSCEQKREEGRLSAVSNDFNVFFTRSLSAAPPLPPPPPLPSFLIHLTNSPVSEL